MKAVPRKILVTCALPYSNGPIHLGHLLEHVQADIWVRFQRMQGHEVYFICGDDAHGSGVMLQASAENIPPAEFVQQKQAEHQRDLTAFSINFDSYYTTHSEENRALVEYIYHKLVEGNLIVAKNINQLFDPDKNLFLADRFVIGTCPHCHAAEQYGDNCEVCGKTTELPS